uniref:WW domain-containing protein n=1 Tax=Mycena chlorophos TaxID=658473 RepID=A0ABQ0M7Y9_MYCCL|nr:predicted protein [Mycena chlorophos]
MVIFARVHTAPQRADLEAVPTLRAQIWNLASNRQKGGKLTAPASISFSEKAVNIWRMHDRDIALGIKSGKLNFTLTDRPSVPLPVAADSLRFDPMAVQLTKSQVPEMEVLSSSTAPQGALRPTTSNDTGRYEKTGIAEPSSMMFSSAAFTRLRMPEPEYLPQEWSAHIHPEGQIYFARAGAPRVVTEAYMYRKDVLDSVLSWVKKIEDVASQNGFPVSQHVELFLKLEDDDDCAYYFVDHSTRAQTWMEDIDTEDLGLPAVVSMSQLNLICEELYWSHVEHFPMHLGALPVATIDSLICVFTHAMCDQMTSRVSTFPYSKQECESFLSLLKNAREHSSDGNIICTVARLWSLICRNRYLTFYGQELARLSRDQAVLYDPATKHEWISTVAARVSFQTSSRYLQRLNDVFVDRIVYAEHWGTLLTGCLRDWRSTSYEAFFGVMLHIFFFLVPSWSPWAVGSAALFGASIFSSMLLVHRFEPMQEFCASQAMEYLDTIESPTFRFQFVALVFALPRTFFLWASLLLLANSIFMLSGFFGLYSAAALAVAALVVLLGFQWTTSEVFNLRLERFRARFLARKVVEDTMV